MSARRASVGYTALGATVAAVMFAAYPLALARGPRPTDLVVTARGALPHRITLQGEARPRAVTITPAGVIPRLAHDGTVADIAPGLSLHTYEATYGARWERQVTLPSLNGPFDREGEVWPCGLALRIGPTMFDTNGAGAGIRARVDRMIRASVPAGLPVVRSTDVRLSLVPGRVRVDAAVTLIEGSRFTAIFHVRLFEEQGRLLLRRDGAVQTRGEGGVIENALPWIARNLRWLPVVGGLVQEQIDAQINTRLTQAIDHGLQRVQMLAENWAPFRDRPDDRVDLRLQSQPEITPQGVTVVLCPRVRLGNARIDPAVPGPVRANVATATTPPPPDAGSDPAPVEVVATPAFANQLLYVLWQSDRMRRWGRRRDLLDALPAQSRDLALRVDGFDPRLPPVVSTRHGVDDAWHFTAGDVAIGQLLGDRVVVHGEFDARVARQPRGLQLVVRNARPRINCVAQLQPGTWRLSPCLSDLTPVLRERVESDLAWTLTDETLERWASFEFRGVRVQLSRMDARIEGPGARLRLRAHATTSEAPASD